MKAAICLLLYLSANVAILTPNYTSLTDVFPNFKKHYFHILWRNNRAFLLYYFMNFSEHYSE